MKKSTKIIALVLVAVMCVAVLASCGGPSGTYGGTYLGTGVEYTFSGNKVSIKTSILGFEKTFDGKFEMGKKDDVETITFKFEDKDADKFNVTAVYSEGKDDNGSYIVLDGVKLYEKK